MRKFGHVLLGLAPMLAVFPDPTSVGNRSVTGNHDVNIHSFNLFQRLNPLEGQTVRQRWLGSIGKVITGKANLFLRDVDPYLGLRMTGQMHQLKGMLANIKGKPLREGDMRVFVHEMTKEIAKVLGLKPIAKAKG